jgi:hypothetical protein
MRSTCPYIVRGFEVLVEIMVLLPQLALFAGLPKGSNRGRYLESDGSEQSERLLFNKTGAEIRMTLVEAG